MIINKHTFFGEVLYRLSVYEKLRCDPHKKWKKEYIDHLKYSIYFMGELLQSMCEESITAHDYEMVLMCVKRKDILSFDEELLKQWGDSQYKLTALHDVSAYFEINHLMNSIVEQLKSAIVLANKTNRNKIWYCLQAFHNLPRAYLSVNSDSVFDYPSSPVQVAVALECARGYLTTISQLLE